MKKYITKHGRELTEEELQEAFSRQNFLAFNESAYKLWRYELLEVGAIREKEG